MERQWIPLPDWTVRNGDTVVGPVLGCLASDRGGDALVLDLEQGVVRVLAEGERIVDSLATPSPSLVAETPVEYALSNPRGMVGHGRYPSSIEATIVLRNRPDHERYAVVAVQGDEARALDVEERQRVEQFLAQYLPTLGEHSAPSTPA